MQASPFALHEFSDVSVLLRAHLEHYQVYQHLMEASIEQTYFMEHLMEPLGDLSKRFAAKLH